MDDYEVICRCGGKFTVRLGPHRYGCVLCAKEVELPPLWLDLELADLDAAEARLEADDPWPSDLTCSMLGPETPGCADWGCDDCYGGECDRAVGE